MKVFSFPFKCFFIFIGSEKKLGVGMVGKKNKGRTGVRERERRAAWGGGEKRRLNAEA